MAREMATSCQYQHLKKPSSQQNLTGDYLQNGLQNKTMALAAFSMATDKSVDGSEVGQLPGFPQSVDQDMKCDRADERTGHFQQHDHSFGQIKCRLEKNNECYNKGGSFHGGKAGRIYGKIQDQRAVSIQATSFVFFIAFYIRKPSVPKL